MSVAAQVDAATEPNPVLDDMMRAQLVNMAGSGTPRAEAERFLGRFKLGESYLGMLDEVYAEQDGTSAPAGDQSKRRLEATQHLTAVEGRGYRGWASAALLLLLPGALTVYLSFNAGGFFPNTPAFAALILAAVLRGRIAFAEKPLAGFSRPLGVAAGALALFARLDLLSGDLVGRSGPGADRVRSGLLYLLALLLFGSLSPQRALTCAG